MQIGELPYIDEHATDIAASVDDAWPVLLESLQAAFSRAGMAGYARIIRSAPWRASGPRPLAEGSTLPGFRVAAAVRGRELALEGRHCFSVYSWIFRLEQVSVDRSRLRAETRAAFPGLAGGVYRLLVIGTGGHAVGVRRLLALVKRRSELGARP